LTLVSVYHFQADVVFCSVVKNLDLKRGAVAKNISKQAGAQLGHTARATFPAGINYGQVVMLPAYDLTTAKNIYLGACCHWNSDKATQSENVGTPFYILC